MCFSLRGKKEKHGIKRPIEWLTIAKWCWLLKALGESWGEGDLGDPIGYSPTGFTGVRKDVHLSAISLKIKLD